MKKQNMAGFSGKKMDVKQMKQILGGATYGPWVCTVDEYRCYWYQYQCQQGCSDPRSCFRYAYCP